MRTILLAILLAAGLHAALPTHEEVLAQWPFGSTVRLTVSQDSKPVPSNIIFGKMQITIPELVKAGFKDPITVQCQNRSVQMGKDYGVIGEAKAADGRTLKLELRCDPKRKQVIGNVTITDAEGNAKSLIIDTPAEEVKGKEKGKVRK